MIIQPKRSQFFLKGKNHYSLQGEDHFVLDEENQILFYYGI